MRKLPALLLVAAVVISVSVWGTSARYVHQSQNEAVVKAKEFYFTSDYLVSGTKKYELNPGQTEVTIQLRNYDGLKVSELDVNYTVTVDEKSYSGTIPAGTATDVPITLNNLEPGKEYVITATGSNGYTKTISAIFTVKNEKEGIFKHT